MKYFFQILMIFILSSCGQEIKSEKNDKNIEESISINAIQETKEVQKPSTEKYPDWLKRLYPDRIKIDYSYGFGRYEINEFKNLNDSISYLLVSYSDGLCLFDSLVTFLDSSIIQGMKIAEGCDNPEPELGYEYSEYSKLNDTIFITTNYIETPPDSIIELYTPGIELPDFEMILDTVIDTMIINRNGRIELLPTKPKLH